MSKPEVKFKCDMCHGVFIKAWTHEDALLEKERNGWGSMKTSHMAEVCDDCYKKIMVLNEPAIVEQVSN